MSRSEHFARWELFDDITKSYLGPCKKLFDLWYSLWKHLLISHIGHLVLTKALNFSKNAQSVGPVLRSEICWVVNALEVHVLCLLLVSSQVCMRHHQYIYSLLRMEIGRRKHGKTHPDGYAASHHVSVSLQFLDHGSSLRNELFERSFFAMFRNNPPSNARPLILLRFVISILPRSFSLGKERVMQLTTKVQFIKGTYSTTSTTSISTATTDDEDENRVMEFLFGYGGDANVDAKNYWRSHPRSPPPFRHLILFLGRSGEYCSKVEKDRNLWRINWEILQHSAFGNLFSETPETRRIVVLPVEHTCKGDVDDSMDVLLCLVEPIEWCHQGDLMETTLSPWHAATGIPLTAVAPISRVLFQNEDLFSLMPSSDENTKRDLALLTFREVKTKICELSGISMKVHRVSVPLLGNKKVRRSVGVNEKTKISTSSYKTRWWKVRMFPLHWMG